MARPNGLPATSDYTGFKYCNLRLSETTNGPNNGKSISPPAGLEPQATPFLVKCHTSCSSMQGGWICFSFPTYIILLLLANCFSVQQND